TIMANLPPPDHTADLPDDEPVQPEPAPVIPDHAPAQPDGYVGDDDMEDDEEEDPKEDPKEDPVEDPKEEPIEQVEEDGVDEDHEKELEEDGVGDGEEEKMEIDDEMDNSEVINLDETEEGKLPPPIPVDPEPEPQAATVGTGRLVPLTGRRLFTNTQVCMGSSSSAATGYDPKDLTLSHIRSDLNALHHRTPTTTSAFQEVPYVPPTALVVPVAHDDPRDPYVVACDATPVPTTYDDDDTTVSRDPQPSKPRRSPRDSQLSRMIFTLENLYPIDDEPMWAADRVVAPTPGSAITIPETANEFAIKGNHLTLVKGNQFDGRTKTDPHKHIHEFLGICDMFKYRDTENEAVRLMMFPLSLTGEAKTWLDELNEGTIKTWDELRTTFISRFFPPALFDRLLGEIRAFSQHENESLTDAWLQVLNAAAGGIFLYKTPNQAYQLLEDKVLLKLDWAKNQKTKSSLKKTVAFVDEGSSNSNTDRIMARMDAMTLKMDAQYKELQTHAKKTKPDLDEDDIPMSREEEAKFMQTFRKTRFYNDYRDRDSNRDNWRSNERSSYNRDNYRSNTDDKPYDLQKQFNDFMKSQQSTNAFVKETFMDLKTQLETVAKNHQASIQNLETKFDRLADKQSGRPSGSSSETSQT
ncbi:reverse transcriptase domain-containing protein, partial [Tanacetum coccineum]